MGEISEKAFPFDSDVDELGNYDREYLADDFARYFRSFISSGIFMGSADNLQIIANNDMTVTLRPGSMIIEGYKYDNIADIIIPIDPADGVTNRIDRISITWSKEERDIHKTVQKGASSYSPIVPECRRNEEYKDYVVADVYIAAGAIKITQDNITDQRLNTEVCGLAIAFSDIDTTMIFNQLQAFYNKVVSENEDWQYEKAQMFEIWFNSVKNQLSGDVAGNLQTEIGTLDNLLTNAKNSLVEAINELAARKIDVLDSQEEIEANTDSGKIAGALAVKEMAAELNNNMPRWTLLWGNPSPDDDFPAQTVTLSSGDYDYLIILCHNGVVGTILKKINSIISSTQATTVQVASSYIRTFTRDFSFVSETQIKISDCIYSTPSMTQTLKSHLKPIKIYGGRF